MTDMQALGVDFERALLSVNRLAANNIIEALSDLASDDLDAIVTGLLASASTYTGSGGLADDLAIVAMQLADRT